VHNAVRLANQVIVIGKGCNPKRTFVEKEHHIIWAREKISYLFIGILKGFLGLLVRLGMSWPWHLLPKAQLPHQFPAGGFTQTVAELCLYCQSQFSQVPKNDFFLTVFPANFDSTFLTAAARKPLGP
jgi:hypothetical protein